MVILEPPSRTLQLLRSSLPESHPGSGNGDFNAKIGTVEDGDCEEVTGSIGLEGEDYDVGLREFGA